MLPSLGAAHVHLVWSASTKRHEAVERESRALTTLRCANNAERHLHVGVTTIRDVGSTDRLAIEVGRAVQLGILPASDCGHLVRTYVSGPKIKVVNFGLLTDEPGSGLP